MVTIEANLLRWVAKAQLRHNQSMSFIVFPFYAGGTSLSMVALMDTVALSHI